MPGLPDVGAAASRVETRITTRTDVYQQWQTLLTNRTKRGRAAQFIVQGVRPINLAIRAGWRIDTLVFDGTRQLSRWATQVLDEVPAHRVSLSGELLHELGGKDEQAPELLAVVAMPPDSLARITVTPAFLGAVFDRPTNPGNIGTIIRSLDAFAGDVGTALIISGHAADPYDPKAVRASTGSLFTVPAVRVDSPAPVLEWVYRIREAGTPLQLVGTDERAEVDLAELDLTGPTLVLIGNETTGLSATWREACDVMARIPIGGAASSLNAATAAGVALYEAARQRSAARSPSDRGA